jgi:hypothetical protein
MPNSPSISIIILYLGADSLQSGNIKSINSDKVKPYTKKIIINKNIYKYSIFKYLL